MKTLKMKSFKSVIWLVLFVWVIAIVMGTLSIPSLLTALSDPIPLDSVDFEGDIEGLYVTGTLYGIYDYYCEETEDYKTIAKEYIIDAGDIYYMGMRAERKDMDAADALMDVSWDYLDDQASLEELEEHQYEVTGTITRIPSDSMVFYKEYIDYVSEGDVEVEASFLPYYLEVNKAGNLDKVGAYVLSAVSLLFILWGCLLLFWIFSGHYQKMVTNYIKNSANPDMTAEKVENFFQTVPERRGLRYNNEFISGQEGGTTAFGEISKLAWVYMYTVTHKRYFITISKTYSLILCFADGTRQTVTMKNEAAAQGHLNDLAERHTHIICGYTEELNKLFTKNRAEFLNLRYNNAQVSNL